MRSAGRSVVALLVLGALVATSAGCQQRNWDPYREPVESSPHEESASAASLERLHARGAIPSELPAGAQRMLDANGFVVLGDVEWSSLTAAYFEPACSPNFITSDAVLYVFHSLFRGALTAYEKQELAPLAQEVVSRGLAAAKRDSERYGDDELLAEPARRNVVFFSVAQAVLTGTRPREQASEAGPLVAKIEAANEAGLYPAEDFTTYRPRGAYAEDVELARYFRAMRWLSRYILPIVPGTVDTPPEADIKLRQARLLGDALRRDRKLRKAWQKLYDEIGFFVARPDSFTPLELVEATKGLGRTYDDAWLTKVRAEFAKDEYPASQIVPVLQGSPGDAPTKYVQFMGERYIPDGQIMQETCFPNVVDRILPRGLDIGFALFGSPRALTHLAGECKSYSKLEGELHRLRQIFRTYGAEEEPESIYAGWVGAAREALHPPVTDHTPEFMKTDAWADKSLTTCLASWTQMRHDFILYAKQPAVPGSAGLGALVEPVPALYGRLEKLARKLAERGFPGFGDFAKLCKDLKLAAQADLADEEWPKEVDKSHLWAFKQWLLQRFTKHVVERPCVVVDVAASTFGPYPVLHEATGPFNLIVARHGSEEFKGWVFSYYEFTEDNLARLADGDWEKRVSAGQHVQYRPRWTESYVYRE